MGGRLLPRRLFPNSKLGANVARLEREPNLGGEINVKREGLSEIPKGVSPEERRLRFANKVRQMQEAKLKTDRRKLVDYQKSERTLEERKTFRGELEHQIENAGNSANWREGSQKMPRRTWGFLFGVYSRLTITPKEQIGVMSKFDAMVQREKERKDVDELTAQQEINLLKRALMEDEQAKRVPFQYLEIFSSVIIHLKHNPNFSADFREYIQSGDYRLLI
ncbi:MAG: hypothetical protein NTY48_06055 [Candidatus Diapherotrites archaeon]|nr:hypothetical protein [Candidatus Diapherotrites archaeon]